MIVRISSGYNDKAYTADSNTSMCADALLLSDWTDKRCCNRVEQSAANKSDQKRRIWHQQTGYQDTTQSVPLRNDIYGARWRRVSGVFLRWDFSAYDTDGDWQSNTWFSVLHNREENLILLTILMNPFCWMHKQYESKHHPLSYRCLTTRIRFL